jgi:seryl-tRNA synthetase
MKSCPNPACGVNSFFARFVFAARKNHKNGRPGVFTQKNPMIPRSWQFSLDARRARLDAFFAPSMLDLKLLREDPDACLGRLRRKGVKAELFAEVMALDAQKRELAQAADALRARQNEASKRIPQADAGEKAALLEEMKEIAARYKAKSAELSDIDGLLEQKLALLPNFPDDGIPDGGEDDFVILKEVGKKPDFNFEPKEHWQLAEALGILDTERSAKVSGSRFFFLRDELAVLQMGLMNWAFLEIQKLGFSPTIPPFMVREEAMYGTGFFPADKNEIYVVNPGEDNLYLIGTSEVPLTSYHADEILNEGELPKKFAGYSPCFRREAGSYGKDVKGILRVHQFEKIEMVSVCAPEDSPRIHEEMLAAEERLLQLLGIPYRVIVLAAGDLGGSATKKYDIEAWLPGQGKYREMTSTSNCTDFQARRLKIRVRRESGEIVMAHTLNGTAVSSRPLIAIMENFQNADGSIDIPEVLWPFTGGMKRIIRNG